MPDSSFLVWSLLSLVCFRRMRLFLLSEVSNKGTIISRICFRPVSRPNFCESSILRSLSWVNTVLCSRLTDFSWHFPGDSNVVAETLYNMLWLLNVVLLSLWCYSLVYNVENVHFHTSIATLPVQFFRVGTRHALTFVSMNELLVVFSIGLGLSRLDGFAAVGIESSDSGHINLTNSSH